jgi:hypothetical protein
MSKELTITKTYSLDKPAEVVAMAGVLKTYVMKQELYTVISNKNYAHVDGWQFAGFLSGMNAIVEEPKNLSTPKEIKWSATAKIYIGDKMVGAGFALCSNLESKKRSFDEYAIMSMAQTRAIGKAYRNKIGWIMKLAGYESTTKEEMVKVDGQIIKQTPEQQPKKTPVAQPTQKVDYVKKLVDELRKRGAKTTKESIALYNDITGFNIKSITRGQAPKLYFDLLNSPKGRK